MVEVLNDINISKFKISKSQFCKSNIIFSGSDNLSANKMAELFSNSQTVIDCTDKYTSAIISDTDVPEWLLGAIEDNYKYNGYYLMVSRNLDGEIIKIKHVPFEMCRLSVPDDAGNFNTIAVCDWGQKEINSNKKKIKATLYPIFDIPLDVAFRHFGHTVSIYYNFARTSTYYPTPRFSAVLQDCAVEGLLQEDRYNALVNGSAEKIVLRTSIPPDEDERRKLINKITEWTRPTGSRVLICNTEFSQTGDALVDDYKVDIIPDNRKLLDGKFEEQVANNIARAGGIPAQLIQTNSNAFSGQIVEQTFKLLIWQTKKDRKHFDKLLKLFDYDITLNDPDIPQITDKE